MLLFAKQTICMDFFTQAFLWFFFPQSAYLHPQPVSIEIVGKDHEDFLSFLAQTSKSFDAQIYEWS